MINVNTLFFNNASLKDHNQSYDFNSVLNTVDAFAKLTNQSCFVIDFDEHKLLYKTEHLLYIDETLDADRKRECENPYWEYITEQTLAQLISVRNNYPMIGETMSKEDYQKHICVIDYPIILKRHYFYITQKFIPLILRQDGITKVGLFIVTPSVRRDFFCSIIANDKRWTFNLEEGAFSPSDQNTLLTKTERIVLQRVKKGLSNEEISDDLSISINTIRTHRKSIFKKLGVKSVNEAITVAENYHML